ncbi:MAG: 23S rRNA (adenine(2503)-C(2))-methyltransferase RlmN [Candidatus Omnitrophica bacterium]|nr:23S rRNA (adenine(2503)-C(2))-methyltransferase RlmN [Candidatus Omnitrophota bacterium]
MKKDIRDFTLDGLRKELSSGKEPPHRAEQVFRWVNSKGALGFDEMTDLPASSRAFFAKYYRISVLSCGERLISSDGTEKFLWELEDGNLVESVLISEAKRRTLCVSSQVGCKYGCPFCSSGASGFRRDLRTGEITGQVLEAARLGKEKITNIVFMGMGEPFDNYHNVEKAIRVMNDPAGIALGARRITVSTCGIIPGIDKLRDLGLQVELSVSLHAADNSLRDELVPANRKYPLKRLIRSCREYHRATGRIITFEYTLIRNVNDSPEDASKLASLAESVNAKVNLIGCSASDEHAETSSSSKRIREFTGRLRKRKIKVTVRKSKGADIMAACGQLAAKKAKGTGQR